MNDEQPQKPKGRPVGRAKGSKNHKISFTTNGKGVVCYRVVTGKHYAASGNTQPTQFGLGTDIKTAEVKRDIVRAEWERCKLEGHVVWSDESLQRLEEQGIAHPQTVKRIKGGATGRIIKQVVRSAEEKAAELDKFKEPDGTVALGAFPHYVTSIFKQELTEPEVSAHIRKAIKTHSFDRPLDALKLALEFWKLCQEAEAAGQKPTPVTLNIFKQPDPPATVTATIIETKPADTQADDKGRTEGNGEQVSDG